MTEAESVSTFMRAIFINVFEGREDTRIHTAAFGTSRGGIPVDSTGLWL